MCENLEPAVFRKKSQLIHDCEHSRVSKWPGICLDRLTLWPQSASTTWIPYIGLYTFLNWGKFTVEHISYSTGNQFSGYLQSGGAWEWMKQMYIYLVRLTTSSHAVVHELVHSCLFCLLMRGDMKLNVTFRPREVMSLFVCFVLSCFSGLWHMSLFLLVLFVWFLLFSMFVLIGFPGASIQYRS